MTMFNLSEASDITGINRATLKRHIDKGYLHAEQFDKGYGYRISLMDLEQYTFDIWMNRRKFPNLAMFNPFDTFADRRDIVLRCRAKKRR